MVNSAVKSWPLPKIAKIRRGLFMLELVVVEHLVLDQAQKECLQPTGVASLPTRHRAEWPGRSTPSESRRNACGLLTL